MEIEKLISIPADSIALEGALAIPHGAHGIVLFAHGSGSTRHSPRNNFVAETLRATGNGTLLMDLLSSAEDAIYENRFDIDLLTRRLKTATHWLREQAQTAALTMGYFGASTGAAAALKAAASLGLKVGAVVSRGGRPDLAREALGQVRSPTLLIVGDLDDVVVGLNREAYRLLKCEKQMTIVPGATHLFEEPGTLQEVAHLAAQWFKRHLNQTSAI